MGTGASTSLALQARHDSDLQTVLRLEHSKPLDASDLNGADLETLRAHISKYRQTAVMLHDRLVTRTVIKSVSQTREENTPVEYASPGKQINPDDEKDFIRACSEGHLHIAKALFKKVSSVECQSLSGGTAAMFAAQGGHVNVLKYLKEKGADFQARDYGGSTPFLEAARGGRLSAIEFLASLGRDTCDISAVDSQGWTALHAAACYGYLDCVQCLIQKQFPKDKKDIDGKTPLDWAVECDREAVVEFLKNC
jgi:ankyrin repeat protein